MEKNFKKLVSERLYSENPPLDPQGIITEYDEVIKEHPDSYEAYYIRGVAKEETGDIDGALSDYRKVATLKPDYTSLSKAFTMRRMGFYYKAIEDFDKAVESSPDCAVLYTERGEVRDILGNRDGALADFETALSIDPESSRSYFSRACIKAEVGDVAGAIIDYHEAIKINPDYDDAYLFMALAKTTIGDSEGAIGDYTKVIELEPKSEEAYLNRGIEKICLWDMEGAIADLTVAIGIDKSLKLAYYSRGLANIAVKDYQGAAADLKKVTEIQALRCEECQNPEKVIAEQNSTRHFGDGMSNILTLVAEEDKESFLTMMTTVVKGKTGEMTGGLN